MASWKEPETNHTAGDQVTPEIFNTLAENEVYLNETKITTNQVQEATVMSETSATRENLTEQDTVMGAFGKIRKWFADLRALAFKDTVATADINNSAVTSDKIASSAVTSTKLGTSSVITSKINALAVTTEKLANLAVTAAKLAASAVTTDKIANSAVTDAKISSVSASKVTGLAEVATSGDYNDLINKPTISSGITLTRTTIRLNQQYNIPATGVYLCFVSYLNAASMKGVACLGTMSNATSIDNGTCSGISSIYYDGGYKNIQLRCINVSSTAFIYRLYISTNATAAPTQLFDGDGTMTVIMYKISGLSAIT
jgi:hypothetical protein|nr:MAG TPA: hypothetical protein [Bacteriophage sp.]